MIADITVGSEDRTSSTVMQGSTVYSNGSYIIEIASAISII